MGLLDRAGEVESHATTRVHGYSGLGRGSAPARRELDPEGREDSAQHDDHLSQRELPPDAQPRPLSERQVSRPDPAALEEAPWVERVGLRPGVLTTVHEPRADDDHGARRY